MDGVKVTIKDNSDAVRGAIKEAIAISLEACGLLAENHAKSNITRAGRVDTGTMRNSVTHEVSDNEVTIGTNVEYAIYNEYGTSRGMTGIHFLRNAVADHKKEYQDLIAKQVKRSLSLRGNIK